MIDKIRIIKERYKEVANLIVQPHIISDQKRYIKINKEYKDLQQVMEKVNAYELLLANLEEAKKILSEGGDAEMIEMAKMEIEEVRQKLPQLDQDIKYLLIPKDPEDAKNVIVEIRAGTGGDEASIFAGDLYRMYTRYAIDKGWKIEIEDFNEGTSGGFKEIIFSIVGVDVYGDMKFESGVHRVQRVPQTETQGRLHTSAATVIVLAEAEEFDVNLKQSDIRIDYFCSSGPGGQSVNTTYSAVRLTHIPTGLVAQCQDQKSQHSNKEKAMKVLRSRLYEVELKKKLAADAAKRNSLVSSGDRSAKIRTYNYPQGRVTEHRIGLTLYDLPNIINGSIHKIIEQLKIAENTHKLKQLGESS